MHINHMDYLEFSLEMYTRKKQRFSLEMEMQATNLCTYRHVCKNRTCAAGCVADIDDRRSTFMHCRQSSVTQTMGIHLNSMKIWWFSLSPFVGCRLSPSLLSFFSPLYLSLSFVHSFACWVEGNGRREKNENEIPSNIKCGSWYDGGDFFSSAWSRVYRHYFINIRTSRARHSRWRYQQKNGAHFWLNGLIHRN